MRGIERGWLVLVAAIVALLVLGPAAPVARAGVQPPDEHAYLTLHSHGWVVEIGLSPSRELALIWTRRGEPELRRSRSAGAGYAMHVALPAIGRQLNLRLGRLVRIKGRFVAAETTHHPHQHQCRGPASVVRSGHLIGSVRIRGDGGYLAIDAGSAQMVAYRSFRLRCEYGHANHPWPSQHPSLFDYIGAPTTILASSENIRLHSTLIRGRRAIEFAAMQPTFEESATFRAAAYEWLPGHLATSRWIEASRFAASNFQLEGPEAHPKSATMTPPAPFAGSAAFTPHKDELRGNLSVDLPGLDRLRLTGSGSYTGLCALTPAEWVCE